MTPKIGYLLPTRESIMEGRPETAPLLRLAQKAEDLGYDSVWIGDSLLARPRHEPSTLLAAVAGRTTRVALGTAVLLPALRNPVVLAHQVATLDQISEGRVILGVGIAADTPPIRAEFEAAGVPFDKRVGRMQEGLRLCRAGAPLHHPPGCSAFAERAVVSRRSLVRIDPDLPFEIAALFGCAVLTGVGAVVNTAAVRAGRRRPAP